MENRENVQLNPVELLQKNKRHKRRRRLFGGVATVVVFITVYLLILPAITMTRTPACGLEEHTHSDACYTATEEIICGLEESAGHTHSNTCYTTEAVLACVLPENEEHTHTDACYTHQQTLICGLEEAAGHTHSDACKKTETELTCSLTEHVHDDSCYPKEEESVAEESAAEETSAEEASSEEEETEEGIVYGDTSADVESAAVWEATMAGVTLTGNWSEDVLAIADSQLGYRESTVNTMTYTDVTGKRVTKGYSRYGAWYGSPYGDWCAMFCSFCLNYAQIPTAAMPQHSGCPAWISVLRGQGLYRSASSGYVPMPGDLIFYDWEGDGCCDHVGLVYAVTCDAAGNATYINTIEGNCNDMVMYSGYRFGDGRILGYGALPENPDYVDPKAKAEKATEAVKKTMTAEGADYTITVSDLEDSGLPEDVELRVNELTGAAYEEKCNEALEALGADENTEITFARFFDVSFSSGGKELEPENPVTVTISYAEEIEVAEEETVNVVHFADSGTEVLPVEVTQEADGTAFVFEQASFSISGTVITSDTVSGDQWITPGAAADYRSILGSAVYYGITANTLIKGAHMDTTLAVKYLTAGGNVTSGMYINDKYGGAYWIGSINGTLKIDGSNTKVYAPQAVLDQLTVNGEKIATDQSTVDAYVESLMLHVQSQSAYLGRQQTTTLAAEQISKLNNGTNAIDFTALPDGTYYILGDAFFANGLNGIRIKLNPGQTVVFNFFNETVHLKGYKVEVGGTSYDSANSTASIETVAKRVIFNMPNCTDLYIDSAIAGTIVAPYATLHGLGGTSSGWLVVDTLDSNNSEWHFVYQDMPAEVPVSAGLTAKKTVNGRTPKTDEKFTFTLEELENGVWKSVQSVQNSGQYVGFDAISYAEEATHWYLVRETRGAESGTTYDTAQYVYRVAVTGTTTQTNNGEVTVYNQMTTAYRVSDPEKLIQNGTINQEALTVCSAANVIFNNLKNEDTDIRVVKVWKDSKGNSLSEEELSKLKVQVTLYRVADDDTENPVPCGAYELSQENSWEKTVEKLPLKVVNEDGTLTEYSYYFEETAVEGVTTTYSPEGRVTEGTVTITNKKDEKPETTEISVDKQWLNHKGEDITANASETVTVDLYRVENGSGSGGTGESCAVTINFGRWGASGEFVNSSFECASGSVITIRITSAGTPEVRSWTEGNYDYLSTTLPITSNGDGTYTCVVTVSASIHIGGKVGYYENGSVSYSCVEPQISASQDNENEAASGTIVDTFTLSKGNGWHYSNSNLPVNGKTADGRTVTYTYYVRERAVANCTTTYENNDGIAKGRILIINQKDEVQEYTLPDTGGNGTGMFTIAGIALVVAAFVLGLGTRCKRKRRPEF